MRNKLFTKNIMIFILIILFFLKISSIPIFADLNKFLELRNAGNYDTALLEIEEQLKKEPENADYKLHKSIILSWQNKYAEAIEILKNIIDKHPNYIDAHITLARIYYWQKKYDIALNQINDFVLSKNPNNQEAIELSNKIKQAQNEEYIKNKFIDNTLSDKNNNKDISLIKSDMQTKKINLFSNINVLRDYEPILNKYPYKEISFRAGGAYNTFFNQKSLMIFYKTGFIKQINNTWQDNEYFLSLNSLALNSEYYLKKIYLSSTLNLQYYNNYGAAYFKVKTNTIKIRPFILASNEMTDYYKIYFAYSLEDWYNKEILSRRLFIEDLHTLSFSNLFFYRKNYYSFDILRAIYSNGKSRNYTDFILQTNQLLLSTAKSNLNLNLKYKYRDYKNSYLHFYSLKNEFSSKNNLKLNYNLGYELSLIKPYTSIGHKFEAQTTIKLKQNINLITNADYFFHAAKDKDREYNCRINLEYKY